MKRILRATKPVDATETEKPPRREIRPFNCDETRILSLAGEIIASGAAEYRLSGQAIKRAKRRHELGQISDKDLLYYVREYNGIMGRERAFMLSPKFEILLGVSRLDGKSVILKLDELIEEYDPTPYVPETDPKTGEPFTLKQWRRILKQRGYGGEIGPRRYKKEQI